jgi:hypothetical protein
MSYTTRVDEMVGKHVKYFQDEITFAKQMEAFPKTPPAMPYGYPIAVYRPLHTCHSPQVREFVARTGGKLSNGVPKVIGMDLVNEYALGLYNPEAV